MIRLFLTLQFFGLALSAFLSLWFGWALMLAVSVAHHAWWPAVPGIGYWWAVLLAFLIRTALASVSSGSGD